jgi:hypothetical protein
VNSRERLYSKVLRKGLQGTVYFIGSKETCRLYMAIISFRSFRHCILFVAKQMLSP